MKFAHDDRDDVDGDDEPMVNEEQVRLKEMYESDSESDSDNDLEANTAMQSAKAVNLENLRDGLSQWSWSMSVSDRLSSASSFLRSMSDLVVSLRSVADEFVAIARKEKSEASAAALKQAKVVGATVVGASRRLQAIRAAEPFAVVVEEACEVMEATLMSVLAVRSLKKLELIGDHRQLPAFIQNCWFNLETIVPSIKTSLFERLVTGRVSVSRQQQQRRHQRAADSSMSVPCTVLDEQRRMRSSISDLTRADYDDIVDILDHPKTATQLIGDHALRCGKADVKTELNKHRSLWHGKGRSVPGVQSCIFFWDLLGNKESRPEQGLSACNLNEAVTIAALTSYLLACGVPTSAITIITPYKGQKNLLIKQLRKLHCLPAFNRSPSSNQDLRDNVTVSTVDRYQGDENDIVILSLVRARPGNRFVALLNRFIVAVSRARLGLYIVGSTNAVTGPEHWNRLLSSLNTVSTTSSDESHPGTRAGPQLPICCPRHAESVRAVSTPDHFPSAANWNSGFCNIACKHRLPCSHKCALPCHSPTIIAHTVLCHEVVPRPCELHIDVPLLCKDVEKKDIESVVSALTRFRCREIVKYSRPECSHVITRFCFSVHTEELSPCEELVRDYYHPVCNHVTSSLKCHVRRQYEASPPQCSRQVDYIRPCGCKMTMPCHNAVQEEQALRPVQCSKSVTVSRPRCKHKLSLRCFESSSLTDLWQAQLGASISSEVNAAVEFGVDYGPPEMEFIRSIPECSVRIAYRDACGHVSELPCSKAFRYAVSKIPLECKANVKHPCPICSGHILIPCWAATLLKAWKPWDAHASGSGVCYPDHDSTVIVEQLLTANVPSALDIRVVNVLLTACKQHITLERACGSVVPHREQIPCSSLVAGLFKRKTLPACVSYVDRVLACRHSVRVRCNERDRLPPPTCRAAIKIPFVYPCGRHQTFPQTCFDLQQLRDSAKDCTALVDTAFYRCGHVVTVPCHLKEAVRRRIHGERLDPHDLYEDSTSDSIYGVLTAGVEYCEPDITLPVCEHPVVIQYACGHFSPNLACNTAFDQVLGYCPLDACKSSVVIVHPVCLHEIETQCWVREEVEHWDPWRDNGLSKECLERLVTDTDSEGNPVDRLCVREEDIMTEFVYPKTVPSALLRCDEVMYAIRACGHTEAMQCCNAFNHDLPPCNELVTVVCPETYCGKSSEIVCHQLQNQPQQRCSNLIERRCTTCSINTVSIECYRKNIECKRAVKAALPHCSHEVTWMCGKELDPRSCSLDAETRSCKQCAVPQWNALINYIPVDHEKDSFTTSACGFVEERINALGNVRELAMLSDKVAVNNHVKARARILRNALDYTNSDSSCIWISLPPIFGSVEDLQQSYHLLFAPVPPNSKQLDWTNVFQTNRPTDYGHGVRLKLFNKHTLAELKPHEDGQLRVCVGLGYHRKMMEGASPFVNSKTKNKNQKEINDRNTKANAAAGDFQKKKGFDCVAVKSKVGLGKDLVDSQEVVHWIPGSVLPVCVASFSLHEKCCICFDQYHYTEGFFCANGHFVCWSSCFPEYLKSASQPDSLQCVDRQGNLCCPECKESYDLYKVAKSGGPPNTFELLIKLKITVHTRKEVANELSEQEKRLRDEFRRIQEMTDLDERQATLLRWSIVEDILTLKCPAPLCKKAFLDFDGCFALSCSACHAGFCAWCLAHCGGDAHGHVANCPERRNGGVYGTLIEFNAHHRQRRAKLVTEKLDGQTAEVRRIVLRLLAKELSDLQIEIHL